MKLTAGGDDATGEALAATLQELMGTERPPVAFAQHVQVDWAQRHALVETLSTAGLSWASRSMLRAQVGDAWLTLAPSSTLVAGIVGQVLLNEDARDPVEPRLVPFLWDLLAVEVITGVTAVINDSPFGKAPAVSPLAETLGTLLVGNADEWGLPTNSVFPDVDLGVRQATHSLLKVLEECPELLAVARSLQAPERRTVPVPRTSGEPGRAVG